MKRADGVVTQEKIIQAALELFVRKGYHGTSVTDIVKKVGLTKGSLYGHFKSKAELLLRIIDECKIRHVNEMTRLANDGEGNALDTLRRGNGFNGQFASEYRNLWVILTFLTTELQILNSSRYSKASTVTAKGYSVEPYAGDQSSCKETNTGPGRAVWRTEDGFRT